MLEYLLEHVLLFSTALAIVLISYIMRNIFSHVIVKKLVKYSNHGGIAMKLISAIDKPLSLIFVILGFNLSRVVLMNTPLSKKINKVPGEINETIWIFILFWSLYRLANEFTSTIESSTAKKNENKQEMWLFLLSMTKFLVVGFGIISILQTWHINITALVGAAGILTAVIGFAAQSSMSNIFGSISILLDQTFNKGDWIASPQAEGTVEYIGLRSTTLRKFDKTVAIVPNGELAKASITNYSRMTNRRIVWDLHLDHNTSADKLIEVRSNLKKYLEDSVEIETNSNKVTTLICYKGFSDRGINLYCYFFTKTTDWTAFMDIQEECTIEFRRIIDEAGARLAYAPTTVYFANDKPGDSTKEKNLPL